MADKMKKREQRSVVGDAAAVREATRVVNAARQRIGDSAEALASQTGELNDRLARATWDMADTWLQLMGESWATGARLTLAWLDLCWRIGWDTWTTALDQQARSSRNQIELWSQWARCRW